MQNLAPYLPQTPQEGVELVRCAGLEVVDTHIFPMTGYSERRAPQTESTFVWSRLGRPARTSPAGAAQAGLIPGFPGLMNTAIPSGTRSA